MKTATGNLATEGSAFSAKLCAASVTFHPQRLVMPLQLSSGIIEEITEARVTAEVEVADAKQKGRGHGSIYLSGLWAWPQSSLDHDQKDAALREFSERIVDAFPSLLDREALHPLEMGLKLHDWACNQLPSHADIPPLARAMCASPLDAAIHDAVGIALKRSAFDFYEIPASTPSADHYFPETGAIRAVSQVLQQPRTELSAWLIINKDDDLQTTVADAIRRRGFHCFKLKITGKDNVADVARTVEIYQLLNELGVESPQIVVDSNEANPDAASVNDYLQMLENVSAGAYEALKYLEQPTSRDLINHCYDWHEVASRKPVMLDEALTDLSILNVAKTQGWSGLALKTCKGHSMLLACAAWARQNDMLISLQDLTNPGISLIHAALVGAYLPTINGAELNSPQFTPAANQDFLPRLSSLFEPQGGVHQLPSPIPSGLGSCL